MVKQVRAARTRQSLVRAAAEVFAADGYALASLPVISRRAGVSAGALHFHFASKDALAAEVESAAADWVRELAERCREENGARLQLLMRTMSGLLLAVAGDPVVRAGFRLGADPSRKSGAAMLGLWHRCVRELVLQAQSAGELAEGVCPDGVTATVVAATVGLEMAAAMAAAADGVVDGVTAGAIGGAMGAAEDGVGGGAAGGAVGGVRAGAGGGAVDGGWLPAGLVEQFWSLVLPGLAASPERALEWMPPRT
ncbi:ScbR family autoregulator-binding transcription factor [Streptomyces sp. NPDC018036]|uniref:ScbR family autoregulator-binding transcription factor n=1 Tax=Streptomyces sp. NPDC018036 TaxID=3365035 RepID=UPI003797AAFD